MNDIIVFNACFDPDYPPYQIGDTANIEGDFYIILSIEYATFEVEEGKILISYIAQSLNDKSKKPSVFVNESGAGWEHFEVLLPIDKLSTDFIYHELGRMRKRKGKVMKIMEYTHFHFEGNDLVFGVRMKPIIPYSTRELRRIRREQLNIEPLD